MALKLARLLCLLVACAAGWTVYDELSGLTKGWLPLAAGAGVAFVVFMVLYFPLARHIAEMISDRLSVMMHRGRHIRAGSGIDQIPDARIAPRCSICGAPEGPVCTACNDKMSRSSGPSFPM